MTVTRWIKSEYSLNANCRVYTLIRFWGPEVVILAKKKSTLIGAQPCGLVSTLKDQPRLFFAARSAEIFFNFLCFFFLDFLRAQRGNFLKYHSFFNWISIYEILKFQRILLPKIPKISRPSHPRLKKNPRLLRSQLET